MRIRIYYLLTFLLLASSAKAQPIFMDDTHTFYGALIGGVSFAQIDGDNYYGYNKVGFTAGGSVYMRVIDNMAASIEILYSQKGSKSKQAIESSDRSFLITKYEANLNYAEVPLQLWYFDKHNHHFGGGFSYSRLIKSSEVVQTDPDKSVRTDIADGKYPFNKSDFNIVLTANFRIWKGLYTGLRFNYSLTPIRTDTDVPPGFGRTEQFNNIVTFKLTYLFMQGSSYYNSGN